MKNLLLMRHAKSSWKDISLPDRQRPLNKRGKHDAPRMGKHMLERGILLDTILCSTAVRARETADGFLEEYVFEGDILYIEDLYHAEPETIVSALKQLPDDVDNVMVIGHNPGFDYFLEMICNEYVHMPTASVAYIKLSLDRWVDLRESTRGELLYFWVPREI